MGVLYKRTQFGFATVAITACTCAVMLAIAAVTEAPAFMFGIIAALNFIVALLFGTLTVRVSSQRIDYWFTFGIVHSSVPVSDVASVQPRRIFPLGFGVRVGDNTTAWLTSGRYAVDLTLVSGRHVVIGTPEPDRVAEAIAQARSTLS